MSLAKRYADADVTTDSLLLISKKLDTQGVAIDGINHRLSSVEGRLSSVEGSLSSVEGRLSSVEKGQDVLMENQLETNRSLAAIMAHLGIPKPGA